MNDYRKNYPKHYKKLGGAGPANAGSEDWKNKKNLYEKRKNYSIKPGPKSKTHSRQVSLPSSFYD